MAFAPNPIPELLLFVVELAKENEVDPPNGTDAPVAIGVAAPKNTLLLVDVFKGLFAFTLDPNEFVAKLEPSPDVYPPTSIVEFGDSLPIEEVGAAVPNPEEGLLVEEPNINGALDAEAVVFNGGFVEVDVGWPN